MIERLQKGLKSMIINVEPMSTMQLRRVEIFTKNIQMKKIEASKTRKELSVQNLVV